METVKWGIIGCGDVAEVKSGPAFQKIAGSELLGVMRRNGKKAQDFAQRHQVPIWTDNADELLDNDEINAIYVATPPSTHLKYTMDALTAGKNVYLEKPMALTSEEARELVTAVNNSDNKLSVAHYRRKLPAFEKVKALLDNKAIGSVLFADIQILQPKNSDIVANSEENWRLNPAISGGGYFYDLAPHQIDLMYHYFGEFEDVSGFSTGEVIGVADTVNGIILFKNDIQFRGLWNFTASETYKKEECVIYGTKGSIYFTFYGDNVILNNQDRETVFEFKNPKHIQQPMIEAVVSYFLGNEENPCSAEEGLTIMKAMEKLSGR
ncbi:oxidoreductase [Croceivirga lutea]|uniref:Gfo/Idh/MocA family protein n=1 Tax=Croceivirga lutea TaxID=1775167 RepID=UPI00163AE5A2|nr:Gfo/Idh/MocA family oxidoreductase [Croceivirga lutea]GGG50732.1 oxidoreductase [Croceivirga lutea]